MALELDVQEATHEQHAESVAAATKNGIKKNGSSTNGSQENVAAFIGPGVEFKGTISYKGSVQIDGLMDGEIHTDGKLVVGEQAVITAKVNAGSVISKGKITGDIVAQEKVQLLSSAVMEGSVCTPQLSMENGVLLNGSIEMKAEGTRKNR